MDLKSFRELLIKKAENNSYLQTLIKYAKDDIIADSVIESLMKMAEPSAAMGRGANAALTSYAGQMGTSDVEQLRDALGHHASRYKAALKTHHGSKDPAIKQAARQAADKHLDKLVPYMHLAGRAGRHSGGKMVLDYRSTTPWETNYTTTERHDHNKKLKEGTKDLGRRVKGSHPGHDKKLGKDPLENITARTKEDRNVPDFRYLEMAPHGGHSDSASLPYPESGYPFEETQLGSPEKRDAGQAYLPMEDLNSPVTEFAPHPFDEHPIHQHADDKYYDGRSEEVKQKFADDLKNWKNGPQHQKWLADQKAKFQADPEAYKKRGSEKPAHFFDGIPLHPQPGHATKEANPTPSPAEEVEAEATTPAKEETQEERKAGIRSKLSPKDIANMTPAMRKILGIED